MKYEEDRDRPVLVGNLDWRLVESFEPAAAHLHNFWKLKPGALLDTILEKRDETLALVRRLQAIADENGLDLKKADHTWLFQLKEGAQSVPDGWVNRVPRSGSCMQCLPADDDKADSLFDKLRGPINWRPSHSVLLAAREDIHARYNGLREVSDREGASSLYQDLSRLDDNLIAEIIGDTVYIQTKGTIKYGHPDWVPMTAPEYYSALAVDLAAQSPRPASGISKIYRGSDYE